MKYVKKQQKYLLKTNANGYFVSIHQKRHKTDIC